MRKRIVIAGAALAVVVAGGAGYGVAQAGAPAPTTPAAQLAAAPHGVAAAHGVAAPRTAVNPTLHPETYFVGVPTCRIVNTVGHSGPLGPNARHSFAVRGTANFASQGGHSGGCGVPADATAVSVRFTAVKPTSTGVIVAYPTGAPVTTGTEYYSKNITSSVGATQPLADNESLPLTVKNLTGRTNLIIDVTGYYLPQIEAYIGGDGSVQTGTDRVVDVVHAGTGSYYIDIDRNVRSCSIQATAYNLYRYASVGYSDSSTPNRISVYIWYLNGTTPTTVDYPFHVLVSC